MMLMLVLVLVLMKTRQVPGMKYGSNGQRKDEKSEKHKKGGKQNKDKGPKNNLCR